VSKLHFITYDAGATGTKSMAERIKWQAGCARSFNCFDTITTLGPEYYMDGMFPIIASEPLGPGRGAGHWVWKPYVIFRKLLEIDRGDTLLYLDADLSFQGEPTEFTSQAPSLGVATFRYGPEYSMVRFTKRDCLIRLDADREPFLSAPQVWSAAIAVHSVPRAIALIAGWLMACCIPGVLADGPSQLAPEYSGFQDHRYDQSVLTIALMKAGFETIPNEMARLFGHPPF
jgi:hypothetical protein